MAKEFHILAALGVIATMQLHNSNARVTKLRPRFRADTPEAQETQHSVAACYCLSAELNGCLHHGLPARELKPDMRILDTCMAIFARHAIPGSYRAGPGRSAPVAKWGLLWLLRHGSISDMESSLRHCPSSIFRAVIQVWCQ